MKSILITDNDRRRLGTMLDDSQFVRIERREHLHSLETTLDRASAVLPTEVPEDVVTMNSTVEILDLDDRDPEVYTLVYPERADALSNRISVLSPMGRAILGHRIGDMIAVPTPSGRRRIRIETILFQPERAGDYHL
jgi:regulator of nucleoside diphosphate kinase